MSALLDLMFASVRAGRSAYAAYSAVDGPACCWPDMPGPLIIRIPGAWLPEFERRLQERLNVVRLASCARAYLTGFVVMDFYKPGVMPVWADRGRA